MAPLQAQRTLVKSPPELWAEISDVEALSRHLGEFGEIRITRLEPETTVAWEGERASGTVELEASGWGTKVTITAEPGPEPVAEPLAEPEPEPTVEPVAPARRPGLFARLFARDRREPAPEPVAAAPEPEPVAAAEPVEHRAMAVLTAVLDDLGAAHHRPFSRG